MYSATVTPDTQVCFRFFLNFHLLCHITLRDFSLEKFRPNSYENSDYNADKTAVAKTEVFFLVWKTSHQNSTWQKQVASACLWNSHESDYYTYSWQLICGICKGLVDECTLLMECRWLLYSCNYNDAKSSNLIQSSIMFFSSLHHQ